MRILPWTALAVLGCNPKVPPHLQLTPDPDAAAKSVVVRDVPSAVALIIGPDPLARSPTLPSVASLEALPDGAALAAFSRVISEVERGEGQIERSLQQLEDDWRGTPVVALSRGYRLRIAENQLAQVSPRPDDTERQLVGLITPLIGESGEQSTLPRRPLEWLVGDQRAVAARAAADRWVLTGWLSTVSEDLAVVGKPLSAPLYDGLRQTPTGRLLVARAAHTTSDTRAAWTDLQRATALALSRVAADRDREQAAFAELKRSMATELAIEGDPEPVLLRRAAAGLTLGAGDDTAAGGALLALAALRWLDACEIAPCTGVDRVETMHAAEAYDPKVAKLAILWQVIALKDVIDTMEVAHDTVLFPDAMVDMVDALIGTGGGPLEARLLRRRRPDPQTWLVVARAVGAEGVTTWEGVRAAVGAHLENEVQRAMDTTTSEETRSILERIGRRALP